MATEQVSIPARLSDPQLFALAVIRQRGEIWRGSVSETTHLGDRTDDAGQLERHRLAASALQAAIREEFPELARTSVPRALQRLDERDLITRWRARGRDRYTRILPEHSRGKRLRMVMLTHRGGKVAGEILRRHDDGRYSLSFETLE